MGNLGRFSGEKRIMKLAIQLTEAQEQRLIEVAARLNVPVESLAEAAVRELIAEPEGEFERVSKRLLEKNRELYKRLA